MTAATATPPNKAGDGLNGLPNGQKQHPPGYSIPEKYKSRLEEVEVLDNRSDDEILASLKEHVPVTSEKNVWGFWNTSVDSIPGWSKRNVIGWIRMLGPSWTVRILDSNPSSPNYVLNFIPASMLPEAFVNGKMHGIFVGPHSADFVRAPAVYLHGGISLDVGTYLTRHLDRWCWDRLTDEKSKVEVVIMLFWGSQMANFFVAARKGNKWVKRWHDLLMEVWKGHTTHTGLIQHPLMSFTQGITFEESRAAGCNWEFALPAAEVAEYITQVFCWIRMTKLEGYGHPDDFDYTSYWQKHVLAFDIHTEGQAHDSLYDWHDAGQKHFDLLTIPVHPPQPDNPQWREAHDLVWHLTSETIMQKVSKGTGILNERTLGTLWPENEGADAKENTFAELLRYGALHFRQTRGTEDLKVRTCEKPKVTVQRGLLEHPPEGELI